ncbi:DUF4038 domain-containing protein [candidate division KSB1 bacterium]|nr:DUF4038 domain-containing protein [candidate division KSB1 bacterium]
MRPSPPFFRFLRFAALFFLLFAIFVIFAPVIMAAEIERYGLFETSFQAKGQYANPFTDLDAEAKVLRPDSAIWTVPLFWDGGQTWKLRVSPDLPGEWSFTIRSKDAGLDGQSAFFRCAPSDRHGSIQPMAGYAHHFSRQDGTPFLFWGDTAWGLFLDDEGEELDRTAVLHYIEKRAAEGVNVIHAMLLSEAGWGNSGGAPFFDLAAARLNPAYWQEVDVRLQHLNENDIIGGLVLAWGDKRRREPWAWRMFADVEMRQRYARYIAARYGAFAVYFIIAGEWHAEIRTREDASEAQVKREFIDIGDVLAAADAHDRMIAIHPMIEHGSVREFNAADWMSFADYQQNYAHLHERILQSRSVDKPVVNSEYGYYLRDANGDGQVDKDNSTPDAMRFATWDILMAGGYPVTGYGTTYMGGHRDPGPFNPDDPRNDIWTRHYHIARTLLARLHWWKLQPIDEAISCPQPRGQDHRLEFATSTGKVKLRCPPQTTYWLLAEPGRHYLLYARGVTKEMTIDLVPSTNGYRAQLYDPRTGDLTKVDRGLEPASLRWTPPDEQDWVLWVTDRETIIKDK